MGRPALVLRACTLVVAACGASGNGPALAPAPSSVAEPSSSSSAASPASGPPIDLDCGDFASCAIAQGGETRCWGRDKMGELGDGGGPDRPTSISVPGIAKATRIAMAAQFACALLQDKRVKCWGTGRIANDGKPVTNARATYVAALEGVEELVASGVVACARTASEVVCWGADAATIGTPPKGAFVQIAAGFNHACARDHGGAVSCWGSGDWSSKGGPFAKPALGGATFLATGDRHACVVGKDKRVLCWGHNDAGQLGTRSDGDIHKTPVAVPNVANAVKLVAGEASTCAILEGGSARCWGSNAEGELGLGKKSSDERPANVIVDGLASMCVGSSHGCALTTGGQLSCWGGNAHGQLGDGKQQKRLDAAPVVW